MGVDNFKAHFIKHTPESFEKHELGSGRVCMFQGQQIAVTSFTVFWAIVNNATGDFGWTYQLYQAITWPMSFLPAEHFGGGRWVFNDRYPSIDLKLLNTHNFVIGDVDATLTWKQWKASAM